MNKNIHELDFTDQSTIEYWDKVYDIKDFNGDNYRQRMHTVLAWMDGLNLNGNTKILEAGCGAGRFAHEAARRGYKVSGMDYSHGMVVKASQICNNGDRAKVAFLQGNIEALPVKPSSFDVIVCLGVIGYLKSEEQALESFARALKPGGILAISIVNKARLVYRLDLPLLFSKLVKKMTSSIVASNHKDADHHNLSANTAYFIPKFRKSLEQAGFEVIETRTVPWKLLSFCGKEIFPKNIATKITLFFERFTNVPLVESFGGMCIFKAEKISSRRTGSGN